MAQTTSALWRTLLALPNTEREYGFQIAGTWYGPGHEVEHTVEQKLYEEFGIGNAASASLTLSLFAEEIPRTAEIRRYVRLKNGAQLTEWLPIEAFDAMRKADAVWEPDQSLFFPMTMPDAVTEFARIMGVEVDARTVLNAAYTIDYPANEYTIRTILRYIAAAHGGNFIMSDAGKLLLVPLWSIPEAVNYLVTEHGAPITFGGVRILV